MLAEYHYRKTFGLTSEEYENEPRGKIRWMLAIADEIREDEKRRMPTPPEG